MDCWPKHSEASGIHCRGWFDNRLRKLDRCATTTWETTHRKQVRVPSKGPSHWLRMLLQPQSLERICHNLSILVVSLTFRSIRNARSQDTVVRRCRKVSSWIGLSEVCSERTQGFVRKSTVYIIKVVVTLWVFSENWIIGCWSKNNRSALEGRCLKWRFWCDESLTLFHLPTIRAPRSSAPFSLERPFSVKALFKR